jgi:uncharacterized Zn finger protein (UPF0148 family)
MDAVRWMLEIICPICERPFYLHLSCNRGDKYCSEACQAEARRRKQKINKKNYESTPEAKGLAAARQRRRRNKNTAAPKAHVTQQTTSPLSKASKIVVLGPGSLAVAIENEQCLRCKRCGQPGVLLRHMSLGP